MTASQVDCQLKEIREIINEYVQIEMCKIGEALRDNILEVLIQEYSIILDNNGKEIKMCKNDCACHKGAKYDQIECICPHYCGDEIN